MPAELRQALDRKLVEELQRLRRELHAHPELAFAEKKTAARVQAFLRKHNIAVVARGLAGHGLVALVDSGRPGPCVALRADMDALPIEEKNRFAHRSRAPGLMHACGHDGHMAVVAGAAVLLSRLRHRWKGQAKIIFQPAEEEGNGARRLVEAGVLENPRPSAILGLHARPELKAGQVQVCGFPAAGTCSFSIVIKGKGAHGAYPHLARDPIVAGAQVVTALQQIVARGVPPFEPAVVTVGAFHAGSRGNIIPERAELRGTLRARSDRTMNLLRRSLRKVARGVCAALGVDCEISLAEGTPPLRNHPRVMDLVIAAAEEVLGTENVLRAEGRTMGGEDFSFYLRRPRGVPGCMFWLGVESNQPLHTPSFDFGERALAPGVLVLARAAWRWLEER